MKYSFCVLVVLVSSVEYSTSASLLPFFNPFQLNPSTSSNSNAESTTSTITINEITTEYFKNGQTDTSQISETSASSNPQDDLAKLAEILNVPLHILQMLFEPHNTQSPEVVPASNIQQPEAQQLLPGLPFQLPIPLFGLPNLVATNNKQSSSETRFTGSATNSDEKTTNIGKN